MVVLGAGILWFGWFGFNAGSALSAGGLASSAFLATHLGAAAAMLSWLAAERLRHGSATVVGGASGAVAGLVAITPASGFVGPLAAIAIGFAAGVVCFTAVELKGRLGYDDSLDAVGVHLVGGLVGALLTGVFASLAINAAGADGSVTQVLKQAAAAGITLTFAFVATLGILKVVDLLVGFRASAEAEAEGIDISEHRETAYEFRESPRHRVMPVTMNDEEIGALRERLVLEATARVLDAVRLETGDRRAED
jgi:Amt family ammonium transporter